MKSIKEELEKLEDRTKITIKLETHLGTMTYNKVRYFGGIEKDGWIHKSGAWCLYEIPGTIEQCYSALFRPYKSKKSHRIKIGFELKSFEIGWNR